MTLLAKLNAKRKNNKGFTLVELIIVVAIIAVLAAVLAPQYIRYVERSRESNDLQVATNIMRAATAAAADPQVGAPANATYTVQWTTTAAGAERLTLDTAPTAGSVEDAFISSIAAVMGWTEDGTTNTFVAEDGQSAAASSEDFIFTIDIATGQITIDQTNSAGWETTIGVNP